MIRTVTLLYVVTEPPTVPLMRPLLLMLSPVGAPVRTNVQDVFAQVDGTVQFTVAPSVVVWFVGVTVGTALTVQVNTGKLTLTPAASVTVMVAL